MTDAPKVKERNPWNYYVLLSQGVFKNVGYELSSEKLVLPYIYTIMGGPLLYGGLLIPIVNISKFGAQVFGAPLIERASVTKWYLGSTTLLSALALAFVCSVATDLSTIWLVVTFLAIATILGACAGFGTLAFQDMLGRVLAEQYRGKMLLVTGGFTGALVIATALASMFVGDLASEAAHIEFIWVGLGMMLLATLAIVAVREEAKAPHVPIEDDAPAGSQPSYLVELYRGMILVWRLNWFRQFLVARALFLSVEVVMPFFAIHAATFHSASALNLGMFVIASSIGMVLGGLIWPRINKSSIRSVMVGSCLVALAAACVGLTTHAIPVLRSPFSYVVTFVLLSFAMQGIIAGRTVYIVGAASDEERPYCVAVSNVVAGGVGLFMAIGFGLITQERGAIIGLVCVAVLNIAAALYVRRLPVVHESGEPEDHHTAVAMSGDTMNRP